MTNDYLLRLVGLGYATTMKAKIQVNQKYVQLELVTGQELGQRLQHRTHTHTHTHARTHRFNGHFSRWTWVSRLPP